MKSFSTKSIDAGGVIEFELDGDVYQFNPPKTATSFAAIMQIKGDSNEANIARLAAMFMWLGQGLNREHQTRTGRKAQPGHLSYVEGCTVCLLNDRLEDPDDDLEVSDVVDKITWLMGEVSGRPTT